MIQHILQNRVLVLLLTAAAVVRSGILWNQSEQLLQDRDAYLAIAQNVAAGQGYYDPNVDWPTRAYRPPLYPLLLAGIFAAGGGKVAIALLHLMLGTATVWLTWRIGEELRLQRYALLAAGFVAVDPLLLAYTALPMTETLFSFLVAVLLWLMIESRASKLDGRESTAPDLQPLTVNRQHSTFGRSIAIGAAFGLAALCRPTIWAFGALVAVRWVGARWAAGPESSWPRCSTDGATQSLTPRHPSAACSRGGLATAAAALTACAIVVAPWTIRNWIVLGKPVVTTTHGGYTLLLGNNPVFYREVVAQPWGTVWEGPSLERWQASLERDMANATPPAATELERDRWLTQQALVHIGNQPAMFLRACRLRFLRFWNIKPLGPSAADVPAVARWGVAGFYSLLMLAMLAGLADVLWRDRSRWMPVLLLLVSFTLVHLVYWSNARMRAPLIPAVAVLAACGCRRCGSSNAAAERPSGHDARQ